MALLCREAAGEDEALAVTVDAEAAPAPRDPRVERLWEALREVNDPEIPISLVDLGLVYDVRAEGGAVNVDLTFTATACPCMAFIRMDIEERLLREEGVREVRIHEVWNPPWTRDRVTPEGRRRLKEMGVSL